MVWAGCWEQLLRLELRVGGDTLVGPRAPGGQARLHRGGSLICLVIAGMAMATDDEGHIAIYGL